MISQEGRKIRDIKLILCGLDNAGKTSILMALKKMYDYEESIHFLKPTIRIEYFQRNFLNLRLNFLDMGGQEKYRNQYAKYPHYFEELDGLIYLIDIQDEKRYIESVNYLETVVKIIKELENGDNKIPINICFSKTDGQYLAEMKKKNEDNIQMLKNLIETRFIENRFIFHYSTIYSIFTISRLISNVLNQINSHSKHFQKDFHHFVEEFQIPYICLFDGTGLIIAEQVLSEPQEIFDKFHFDTIISDHLAFSGMIRDEEIELCRNITIEEGFTNVQYQFNLQDQVQIVKNDDSLLNSKKSKLEDKTIFFLSIVTYNESNPSFEHYLPYLFDNLRKNLKNYH